MNLVYGELVEVFSEEGLRFGKIRVAGAMKKVPLELLTDVEPRDTILVCDGVGISQVTAAPKTEKTHVPRHLR